jgi:hypothetical protein
MFFGGFLPELSSLSCFFFLRFGCWDCVTSLAEAAEGDLVARTRWIFAVLSLPIADEGENRRQRGLFWC